MRRADRALLWAAVLAVLLCPDPGRADGLFEALSGSQEVTYSLISTKTTDASGTRKTQIGNFVGRDTLRVNYNLLPTLNLNAGGSYEKNLSWLSGSVEGETEITRIRPYAWLTFRDPTFSLAAGYDRSEDTTKASGAETTSLIRDTYNANLNWRPTDLPMTQVRYTRTSTRDDPLTVVDTQEDQIFLKSEYLYRGLDAYYAGNYVDTRDGIRDSETRQTTHEGKLLYTGSFFDGRVALTTDHRIRFTQVTAESGVGFVGVNSALALQQAAVAGLSALDDTPIDGALAANPAIIDGDVATSAGVNIGFQPGDTTRRNVGLDFGTPVQVNRLFVWVTGFGATAPPPAITSSFSWDIYTSTDNLTWTFVTTIAPAAFGPFDFRFTLDFPAVTARYIKAVTQPLSGAVPGAAGFPNILVAEVQAFIDTTSQAARARNKLTLDRTFRSHSLDVKTILLRSPLLYHRLTADYQESTSSGQDPEERYNISNGLYIAHRLSRIFSTSANGSFEFGRQRDEARTAVLYYASLSATPLRTLTDSVVFSGNHEWLGDAKRTTDSLVLTNTAQLYRGLDATLNLGAVLTSDDPGDGTPTARRRDLYLNLGTGVTPHPSLTLTTYYLGRMVHASGGSLAEATDTVEHRVDLGLSFTPVRSLALSAATNIVAQTDRRTTVLQTYGLAWAPFPDGTLQMSFNYTETSLTDTSSGRTIQPTVRWYLTSRRRSYLEATYQYSTTETRTLTDTIKTETQLFSTTFNLYF